MLSRPFLTLLRWRRCHRWLLLAATAAAVVVFGCWESPDLLPRLIAVLPLLALLGAPEPALVVLVAAEGGAVWAAPDDLGYGVGLGTATAAVLAALFDWRTRDPAPVAAVGTLLILGVIGLAVFRDPWLAGNAATALVLAGLGTDILLPRGRGGAPSLLGLLGGIWIFTYALLVQAYVLCFGLPVLRWSLPRARRAGRKGLREMRRWFPYGKREFFGVVAEAFEKPAIVVSNHQSSVDITMVLALPGDVRLTTSPRVWDEPWLGYSARRLGHVRVDENLMESCRRVLGEGACVHFFPEGTRSRDGYPARFHRGAFELAAQLGCDIVPVVFCDTRAAVPRDAYWVERYHLAVRVLPRIPADADSKTMQKRVQALVREEFSRDLNRLNTPSYVRRKVRWLYRYQGWRVGWHVRREFARAPDPPRPESDRIHIENCGYGIGALLLAERFPSLRIDATDPDPHKIAIAQHAANLRPRVRFRTESRTESGDPAANSR